MKTLQMCVMIFWGFANCFAQQTSVTPEVPATQPAQTQQVAPEVPATDVKPVITQQTQGEVEQKQPDAPKADTPKADVTPKVEEKPKAEQAPQAEEKKEDAGLQNKQQDVAAQPSKEEQEKMQKELDAFLKMIQDEENQKKEQKSDDKK